MMKISKRGAILGILAVLLAMILGACSGTVDSDDDATLIRLENGSAFALTNVTFSAGHGPIHFDRITPGARTEYVELEQSYSYGYLKFTADGGEYTLQPVDYVGEEEIGPGRFTVHIVVTRDGVGTIVYRED